MNTTQKADALINSLATDADIIALVRDIEAKPATTKDHYGDYGTALATLSGGRQGTAKLLALAFIKAGANKEGVMAGLRNFV